MTEPAFPLAAVRAAFPALSVSDDARPRIYLDAPGGTQVCRAAIDAMAAHLSGGTANSGGPFRTSLDTDATSDAAHAAVADLLGACAQDVAFGPNMTSLTFAASRALAQRWQAGDELVVTRLDHDANVAPWLAVARDRGMTVRWLDFDPATGRLDLEPLDTIVGPATRLVAIGAASNALGTLNPVAEIIRRVRARSDALVFVDAVQSVPHVVTDVAALGCDLLACSPYKVFGPHQGVLWARPGVLDDLVYKVRPASGMGVRALETGTPSFEGQAGMLGMIGYLEWLGGAVDPAANSRRARLVAAMTAMADYETALGERLLAGLQRIPGLRLWGPPTMAERVPTFAFTLAGHTPDAVAQHLADHGIFAWSGHFYAVEVIDRLGLGDTGGLVRVGLCHYNAADEVDRLLDSLAMLD